jgi:hypothetical protein
MAVPRVLLAQSQNPETTDTICPVFTLEKHKLPDRSVFSSFVSRCMLEKTRLPYTQITEQNDSMITQEVENFLKHKKSITYNHKNSTLTSI